MKVLIGDIGGTNTRLSVLEINSSTKITENNVIYEKTYASQRYISLNEILVLFLKEVKEKIEKFVFAIAGPIVDGTCKFTNVNWVISEEEIKEITNSQSVKFINDLEAQSYLIPHLDTAKLMELHKGTKQLHKNICVLAPGTGLGEAFLTWDGSKYVAHPTEGGHTNFSPENQIQIELLDYLTKELGSRVSIERVCSSIGLRNIFNFLWQKNGLSVPNSLQNLIKKDNDPVPAILDLAINHAGTSKLCDKTFEIFLQILGSECGNFALKILPRSGLFLSGGIPQKNVQGFVQLKEQFMTSFLSKGRMKPILKTIPIYLMLQKRAGILGAAYYSLIL